MAVNAAKAGQWQTDDRGCSDLSGDGFDADFAAQIAWTGLAESGCFREGEWKFADDKPDDPPATIKTVADYFFEHAFWGPLILAVYEAYPCLQTADAIIYVPEGPREFATELGKRANKPVAHIRRKPGGGRHDYEFMSDKARQLIGTAKRPFIVEDITSTLSSPAAVRTLMAQAQSDLQDITLDEAYAIDTHVLSILLRGTINPKYQKGLTFHTLVERPIPRQLEVFKQRFPGIKTVR